MKPEDQSDAELSELVAFCKGEADYNRWLPPCGLDRPEVAAKYDAIIARLTRPSVSAETAREGIYIASKTKHAWRWRQLRDSGVPVISTWIDEAGEGESADLSDLWRRCIEESKSAKALILYKEPEDTLKGAWVELGAALASGTKVYAVGIEGFTVAKDARITHCKTVAAALARYNAEVSDG